MKFKAGDIVYVVTTDNDIVPGVYTIDEILYNNRDAADGAEYPYCIHELPINLNDHDVREVTPLDELL